MNNNKILIIDTENYAGNFEIELCAYVTGQIGDCGVGEDIAKITSKEIKNIEWWKNNIRYKEEDGYSYPCDIWETIGWVNDGNGKNFLDNSEKAKKLKVKYPAYLSVAIFVKDFPPKEVWEEFMNRAIKFTENTKEHKEMFLPLLEEKIEITSFRQIDEEYKLNTTKVVSKMKKL